MKRDKETDGGKKDVGGQSFLFPLNLCVSY